MAMNRALVGKEYPPATHRVSAEDTKRYARAYNEDNPRFLDESRPGGIIAPPLFGVVVMARAVAKAVGDPELQINFPLALHGEQDMDFLAPMRPGDEITTTARIDSIEDKGTGETLVVLLTLRNQEGEPVQLHRFGLFVRSGVGTKGRSSRSTDAGSSDPDIVVEQRIDSDQTFRYADASGDRVPLRLDDEVARKAGLPGIIVHGLCTMAFTSKAAIDALCDGDPTRLARLAVRFARPVLPGQTIATHFRRSAPGVYSFETFNPEGAPVIRSGVCEVRS